MKTPSSHAGAFWSGAREVVGWLVPVTTLALVPKYPACVAGYLALATGIGISLPTATYVRALLIGLCVACLIFLAARRLRGMCRAGFGQPESHAGNGDILE